MNEFVIITRHLGLVEWLRIRGIIGQVISQASPTDVAGKVVIGALPPALAALASEVISVDMPKLRPDQRGQDLTPEEMDIAGAKLSKFITFNLTELEDGQVACPDISFNEQDELVLEDHFIGMFKEFFFKKASLESSADFIRILHEWSLWDRSNVG